MFWHVLGLSENEIFKRPLSMGTKIILMELENKGMLMLGGFSTGYESRFCHSSGPVDPGS